MKNIIFALFLLSVLGTFGYSAAHHIDTLPSVESIIEKIKHSSPPERKKALSLLKQKLKGIKKTKRHTVMRQLKQALQRNSSRSQNRASEIFGSLSSRGDVQGHNNGYSSGAQGGGGDHGGGGGGHGGGGGNGSGGGGHGGR